MTEEPMEWEKEFDEEFTTNLPKELRKFNSERWFTYNYGPTAIKLFIKKLLILQHTKDCEEFEKVKNRLLKYRCGKHWIVVKMIDELLKGHL